MNLDELIEAAREHVKLHGISTEEHRAQAVSFAHGNCAIENPNVTREMVERAYDKLQKETK